MTTSPPSVGSAGGGSVGGGADGAGADSSDVTAVADRVERLAGLAGRGDLVERLGAARSRVASRPIRVAVAGDPGDGADTVTRVLRRVAARWLPGASFFDAPGGPAHGSADVVLYVTDAGREYGRAELDTLTRLHGRRRPPVVGVHARFDVRSNWAEVQRADRARLQDVGLDSPSIPLLPVSANLCEYAWARNDDASVVASGVPQLLEVLRDRIGTPLDPAVRDGVFAEARFAAEQLVPVWSEELTRLRNGAESPQQRQQLAVAELDRRQQLSTSWQIALNDGVTELGAQVDFDLRERLREVLEFSEKEIRGGGPFGDWAAFDTAVGERMRTAAAANQQVLHDRAGRLATRIAGTMTGATDGSTGGVALPRFALQEPTGSLERVSATEAPEGGGSMTSRVVNSVRGSYGGVLMVGVMTSLAGEKLISVYSVGAGLLLGAFTFWEDRKNTRERRQAEAKVTAAKLLDDANFRIGDHQRTQLRQVHRTLRDHFTAINDARLKDAADAVRAASDSSGDAGRQQERIAELEAHLAECQQLRELRPAALAVSAGAPVRRRARAAMSA